jgi:hypothetical protein
MSVQLMPLIALAAQITSCNSYEAFDYLIVDDVMTYEKKYIYQQSFLRTYHREQELPTLHREMQHNRDLHLQTIQKSK